MLAAKDALLVAKEKEAALLAAKEKEHAVAMLAAAGAAARGREQLLAASAAKDRERLQHKLAAAEDEKRQLRANAANTKKMLLMLHRRKSPGLLRGSPVGVVQGNADDGALYAAPEQQQHVQQQHEAELAANQAQMQAMRLQLSLIHI